MSGPTKIILHCHDSSNLTFMARAARTCMEADMAEGDWKVLTFGEGQLPRPVYISAIRRKSCITIYDQPKENPDDD